MEPTAQWDLIVSGCGTAGFAGAQALCHAPFGHTVRSVALLDRGLIRSVSTITCPAYAGHVGRPKAERLAELTANWLAERVPITALYADVHDVDWDALVNVSEAPGFVFVLIGLDCWPSRLSVLESLRHSDSATPAEIFGIQLGLERDEAQVSVFGNQWSDPCSACGLLVLPQSEPCIVFENNGQLLRGNLRAEAEAAACRVVQIVGDCLTTFEGANSWRNTKTNLTAVKPGGDRFEPHVFTRTHMDRCMGPHSPQTPIGPDQIFQNA